MTDDVRKLLGGYATNNLTEDERKVLFAAALDDEKLFEALADEQALKELLEDPAARAEVLRATEEPRFSVRSAFLEWLDKPMAKALVATGLGLLLVIVFVTVRKSTQRTGPAELARLRPQEPAPAVVQTAPMPAPKQSARTKNTAKPARNAEPATVALAPQPVASQPSVASNTEVLTRAASKGDTRLEYTLQARDATGVFRAVLPEALLASEAALRLDVKSNRAGYLNVTTGSERSLFSGYIAPNQSILIPASGSFTLETPGEEVVRLAFAQVPNQRLRALRTGSNSFRESEERRKAAAVGETRAEEVKAGDEDATALLVELSLKHR